VDAATAKVTTLLAEAGLVPNLVVMPAGRPDAARVTLPVNGLTSVTVMVSVPLAPWAIVKADAEGVSLKPPVAAPQVVPLIAKDAGTALVTPFQVPLNPMPVRLPPAGMLPLYGSFFTVTLAPLWVSMPFQSCETVWPLAKVQVRVQLDKAVVPVFWMVIAAPKALVFCGEIA